MDTLRFENAVRQGSKNQHERTFRDFIVSEKPLRKFLEIEDHDFVSPFVLDFSTAYKNQACGELLLEILPSLTTNRVILYACPECGDVGCGAITAIISQEADSIIWSEFGRETDYGGISEIYYHIEPIIFDKHAYFTILKALRQEWGE